MKTNISIKFHPVTILKGRFASGNAVNHDATPAIEGFSKQIQSDLPSLWRVVEDKFPDWIRQFKSPEDQAFATKLLKGIQYYDAETLRQQLALLHQRLLQKGITPNNTLYTYFGNGKSGGLIAYFYRQANGLRFDPILQNSVHDHFIDATQFKTLKSIPREIKNLVILDDQVATGIQAAEMLKQYSESLKLFQKVIFSPLVASEKGLQKLANDIPSVEVLPAQIIYPLLHEKNPHFSPEEKKHFLEFTKKYQKLLNDFTSQIQVCDHPVTFFYNSPSSLPSFLRTFNSNWTGLFKRYANETGLYVSPRKQGFSFKEIQDPKSMLLSFDIDQVLIPWFGKDRTEIQKNLSKTEEIIGNNHRALKGIRQTQNPFILLNTGRTPESLQRIGGLLTSIPLHAISTLDGQRLYVRPDKIAVKDWFKSISDGKTVPDTDWINWLRSNRGFDYENFNSTIEGVLKTLNKSSLLKGFTIHKEKGFPRVIVEAKSPKHPVTPTLLDSLANQITDKVPYSVVWNKPDITPSGKGIIYISHRRVDKGTPIEFVVQNKFPTNRVFTFGDSSNDAPMLNPRYYVGAYNTPTLVKKEINDPVPYALDERSDLLITTRENLARDLADIVKSD